MTRGQVAELQKEAGNTAFKRQEHAEAVEQYTLAVGSLGQIGAGSGKSGRLLAVCLTNRGVARLGQVSHIVIPAGPCGS